MTDPSTTVFLLGGNAHLDDVVEQARKYQDVARFYVDKKAAHTAANTFIAYRTVGVNNGIAFKGDLGSSADILAFIEDNQRPLFPELSGSNFEDLVNEDTIAVIAVVNPSKAKDAGDYKSLFTELAQDNAHHRRLTFRSLPIARTFSLISVKESSFCAWVCVGGGVVGSMACSGRRLPRILSMLVHVFPLPLLLPLSHTHFLSTSVSPSLPL